MKGLVLHREEALRANTGTRSMLRPLVLQQSKVRGDVEVLREVSGRRVFAAEHRVGPIVVLRPKTVENKAGVRGALRRGALNGAKLGRPGQVHQVEIEMAGLPFLLSICGGKRGKDGRGDSEKKRAKAHVGFQKKIYPRLMIPERSCILSA